VRVVLCAELKDRLTGDIIFYFNTHLDHMEMRGDFPIQRGQAEILISLANSFCRGSHAPRVYSGDLNSKRKAGAPAVFFREGCKDASRGDDKATFAGFHDRGKAHIDWIFAKHAHLGEYKVHLDKYKGDGGRQRNLSDHRPISATLSFQAIMHSAAFLLQSPICCIRNKASGRYLNKHRGDGAAKGAKVHVWSSRAATSQWILKLGQGTKDIFTLQNVASETWLNKKRSDGSAKGGTVQMWTNPTSTDSQWRLVPCGGRTFALQSVSSGMWLNKRGRDGASDGAKVHMWDNPSSADSRWVFDPVKPCK